MTTALSTVLNPEEDIPVSTWIAIAVILLTLYFMNRNRHSALKQKIVAQKALIEYLREQLRNEAEPESEPEPEPEPIRPVRAPSQYAIFVRLIHHLYTNKADPYLDTEVNLIYPDSGRNLTEARELFFKVRDALLTPGSSANTVKATLEEVFDHAPDQHIKAAGMIWKLLDTETRTKLVKYWRTREERYKVQRDVVAAAVQRGSCQPQTCMDPPDETWGSQKQKDFATSRMSNEAGELKEITAITGKVTAEKLGRQGLKMAYQLVGKYMLSGLDDEALDKYLQDMGVLRKDLRETHIGSVRKWCQRHL